MGVLLRQCYALLNRTWRHGRHNTHLWRQASSSSKTHKNNIILMGSPGSGKTTVGRILAAKLNKPVLDVDDDHLESFWGMPVSQKLDEVGSEGFVEAEGEALLHFESQDSVVSLTGSNPMHDRGMDHVAESGVVVFLDVHPQDVLDRLERMKVNRIVGQNDGTAMADILKYRQQFYEKSYDVRVICERNEAPDSVADKVISKLNFARENPGYTSTRESDVSDGACHSFSDVMINSLCENGGLFVPKWFPDKMSLGELGRLVDMDYSERALRVIEQFIPWKDIHPRTIRKFAQRAYSKEVFGSEKGFPVYPLVTDGNHGNQYLLELFHGPTASFKDAALQLMPQMFRHAIGSAGQTRHLILVATSGDTGGAVLDGFRRHAGDVGVLVLYPDEGVSSIQKQQMVSLGGHNAMAIGIKGWDFDACQTVVKRILNDAHTRDVLQLEHNTTLSAANSISWGRLLPQVVYHVTSYLEMVRAQEIQLGDVIDLCVPTGNFGNILAASYAKKLGIPYGRLICASNANNVITDFLNTGVYDLTGRTLVPTSTPAIDILVSSNLERLLYHTSGSDGEYIRRIYDELRTKRKFTVTEEIRDTLKRDFLADWCNEENCARSIRGTMTNHGYLLDTHTAVAKAVADRFQTDRPLVIAATAHPGKFAEDILKYLDVPTAGMNSLEVLKEINRVCGTPDRHERLYDCVKSAKQGEIIHDPSFERIVQEIGSFAKRL